MTATNPEVLVLSFCGRHLPVSLDDAAPLIADGTLDKTGARRVIAVDGSAWLSRPGPRLVDGLEALAFMLHDGHPDLRPEPGMAAELIAGEWVDAAVVRV
jgi:iron complex transport system substrate-binding protein